MLSKVVTRFRIKISVNQSVFISMWTNSQLSLTHVMN